MNESIILNAIEGLSARIDDISARMDKIDQRIDNMDRKFTRKFNAIDTRLSFVEEMQNALKVGQEEGFARLSGEIKALDQRFTEFEERNEREHEEFRNAIGISQY